MKIRFAIISVILFVNCQALINFKVPPFTITNAQTAAEKQMVGEDRDLEKDGWLVSSIQSSSGANVSSKSEGQMGQEDPEFSGHLMRLNYLKQEIKRYKMHGIIGEGLGGILKQNPQANLSPFYPTYDTAAKKKRVEDVVTLTNESRKIVIEKQVEIEKKKGKKEEELKVLRQNLIDVYQKTIIKGEFYEANIGKWERM